MQRIDEHHLCLVCYDTVEYEITGVKKIYYGYIVRRQCPQGHVTIEHRKSTPAGQAAEVGAA